MKIWSGFGSEHSMNLVLIGKFKKIRDAENVENFIQKVVQQAGKDEAYLMSSPQSQRFSEEMLSILEDHKIHMLQPSELEQFTSEHSIDKDGDTISIRTDEVDVSAFIKIFIEAGAQVEVYSAHDYPDKLRA